MITLLFWIFGFIPSFFIYVLLGFGISLYLFSEMATLGVARLVMSSYLTPALVRIVGLILIALSIFLLGVSASNDRFKALIEKKNAEIAKINEEAKDITQRVEIKYVYKDKIIKERGNEIIKYVTKENDASCDLHTSTIELLNAAAKNEFPNTTRATDATSSGVELSTVQKVIIENYNMYNTLKNKNDLLQEWIREQQKNNK